MTQEKNTEFFSTLQSDYAAWLAQVLLSSFYDEFPVRQSIIFPVLLSGTTENGLEIPSRTRDSQGILHELAHKILATEGKPSRDIMETFLATFENFQSALQKLEHGLLMADFGIDELTGMNTFEKMIPDLEKELERRSRRGQPFCFVISRIDGDEPRQNPQNILLAAKCLQKTIRSFDDAYVSDTGEFLSSLKHSDNNGGLKFIVRLNSILRENHEVDFTMSSFVAEPLPGDNITDLVEHVRNDLEKSTVNTKSLTGQYEEISPLNLYLKNLKDQH